MDNNNKSAAATSGIGVTGLLGVAFIVLKLCHVIDWSWWIVTLPLWGGFVIALVLSVVLMIAVAKARK